MKNIKNFTYICDGCKQQTVLNRSNRLRRRVLQHSVFEFYFTCSKCKHEHVAYYTNKKIRRDIKRQEKHWEKYREQLSIYDQLLIKIDNVNDVRIIKSEEQLREILATIKRNDRLMERDMIGLKNRMERMLKVGSNG